MNVGRKCAVAVVMFAAFFVAGCECNNCTAIYSFQGEGFSLTGGVNGGTNSVSITVEDDDQRLVIAASHWTEATN